MKQNNKTHILFRYGIITFAFLIFAIAVVVKLIDTTVVTAPAWNERAHNELSKTSVIPPERGNILASNGNILACNLKVYDIKLDLRHNKVMKQSGIPWAKIDSLADSLDYHYPRIRNLAQHPDTFRKYSWHTRLKKEFDKDPAKRTRALRITAKKTIEDFERIRNFPYLRDFKGQGFRIPIYKEEKNVRIYPYGRMAYRSIGRVNESYTTGEFHGYSGLEKDLDTLLYGKPGIAKKVALTSGIANWMSQAPVRGFDIHTTIDIDLQDMLEQELLNVCQESKAEWGTAILMEVATGEIKAISNIELLDNGTYGEALNRAVQAFEPGSVMKPISLMIAFEDGLVKSVNDTEDCSPFQRTNDPHGSGRKTMKQIIEQSSNTGIARVIFRGYESDPARFHDRLASIGFFEPMHTGIAGECIPRVRKLLPKDSRGNNITMTARHLDLARQAYGYNTEIPPLYTLSIYNAIANGGKYVRPHLVRALIDEEGRDSIMPISYIRDRICSEETARKVRECIREVVWGEHGTAKMVRDDRVDVVGKTGTAYPVANGSYDKSKRRYAFAGFFPYEQPMYSCMALVLGPSGWSANRTSGQVVKNMAVKMFSRGMLNNSSSFTTMRNESTPVLEASQAYDSRELTSMLGINRAKKVKAPGDGKQIYGVPDVVGYDAPTAVRILESNGLNVLLKGSGRVVSQSLPKGSPLRQGDRIVLNLKI
ncbi:MAG: PASTA domain-containing protein [Muribaculaceae bacterium]|nr:PASTA domain-containing protein [Muribaculaceae bacterium]MDE6533082.1 PASTA domain-containing protein [Muribaculaceae bacterium]